MFDSIFMKILSLLYGNPNLTTQRHCSHFGNHQWQSKNTNDDAEWYIYESV